jgi:site-specific DNA recombinase
MLIGRYSAFLDANVLHPAFLRAALLWFADERLLRPVWSRHVLEEWRRSLKARHADLTDEKLDQLQAFASQFPDAEVTGYEPFIGSLELCVSVPSIISEETFARVQEQLALRSPKLTPPRIVNSVVLLTGLVICGGCGLKMQRQPGKGGKYHYFRCASVKRTGSCPGGTRNGINVATLDAIVLEKVADQILTPTRVQGIVSAVAAKREAGSDEATTTLRQLREQRAKTTKKLSNLINMLAEGTVELSDTYKLAVKEAEADAKRLANLIATLESVAGSQLQSISLDEAKVAASQLREKLLSGEAALKRRLVRSFIKSVVVTDDKIVIIGAESDLAEVVTGSILNV